MNIADSPASENLVISALLIINFMTIVGNLFVIFVALRYRRVRKSTPNMIIFSLSIADFFVGIAVMPFSISQQISNVWSFGPLWCILYLSLDVWLCTASIYNLLTISIDRLLAISRPLRYKTTYARFIKIVLIPLGWLASLAVSCPPVILWATNSNVVSTTNTTVCVPLHFSLSYVLFTSLASFYIPAALLLVFNVVVYVLVRRSQQRRWQTDSRILLRVHTPLSADARKQAADNPPVPQIVVRKATTIEEPRFSLPQAFAEVPQLLTEALAPLRKKSHSVDFLSVPDRTAAASGQHHTRIQKEITPSITSLSAAPIFSHVCMNTIDRRNVNRGGRARGSRRRSRLKRLAGAIEFKAIRSMLAIVGCFLICWTPFSIVYLLDAIGYCSTCLSQPVFDTVVWLGYFNSAINPVLYAAFSHDFRVALQRFVPGRKQAVVEFGTTISLSSIASLTSRSRSSSMI